MRNLMFLAIVGILLTGCKASLEHERDAFIERCMEKRLFRGETYQDVMPVCTLSADRFIGKVDYDNQE